MITMKQQWISRFRESESVIGVIAVENPSSYSAVTDGFDLLLLVISQDPARTHQQYHYSKEGRRIQERWMSPEALDEFILHGEHRNIIYWILKGEILLDRDMYLEGLRHRVLEFPVELREHKLLIEFSKFLRSYLQTKEYISEKHELDAYHNIFEALHHWARIVIIEAGYHPEVTVWRQIKSINPGVYKLYEELMQSSETVEQRVQLVLLACEFSVMSKMERCCKLLIEVLGSREVAWSLEELQHLPKLTDVRTELPLLLNKLVSKALAREVAYVIEDDLSVLELRYTL
jgi:hypothetical protein